MVVIAISFLEASGARTKRKGTYLYCRATNVADTIIGIIGEVMDIHSDLYEEEKKTNFETPYNHSQEHL